MACENIGICTGYSTLVFSKNGFDVLECSRCRHRFCKMNRDEASHLAEVYADSYFFEGKEGYPDYLQEKDILVQHGRFYAGIAGKYAQPGKMLDVGAAAGFIMQGFQDRGWKCTGIEPNKSMVEYCRDQLRISNEQGSIENANYENEFDLVTLIQVIGHFYDLDRALYNISRSLKENGLLIIECWDRSSALARLLGKSWHEYSPPSVLHWFTPGTLDERIRRLGYSQVEKGRPKKKIGFRHALSLLATKYKLFKLISTPVEKIMGHKDFFLAYPPLDIFYVVYKKDKMGTQDGMAPP